MSWLAFIAVVLGEFVVLFAVGMVSSSWDKTTKANIEISKINVFGTTGRHGKDRETDS